MSAALSSGDRIVDAVHRRLLTDNDEHGLVAQVCQKLLERSKAGQEKYGVTLERTDLTIVDWLNHAQQEAMDLINYLEVLIQRTGDDGDFFGEMQAAAIKTAVELEDLLSQVG